MTPQTTEEKVIWVAMTWTYGFFLLGALYPLAPAIAWLLLLAAVLGRVPVAAQRNIAFWPLPVPVWVWLGGMLMMLVALVVAHIDFELGFAQTIKSSIGWAKGWALLAIFLVIGGMRVRPELLSRAACIVGVHTLIVLPLMILAFLVGLPEVLYVSPLMALGGPGPEFFDVSLYSINPANGMPRWRLFTPWGPALGFVGCVFFMLSLRETDRYWRMAGIAGSLAMILSSGSRLALLAIPAALLISWGLRRIAQPRLLVALAAGILIAGFFGAQIEEAFEKATQTFHGARADSSRVRATLGRIAVDRWAEEAQIWGHGVVERGPHLVEYMPIGSHHSWYGLLFVKGIVGLLALAIPLLVTLIALLRREGGTADTGLRILLLLFFYTFGENLEILSYLYWPGIVMLGIALFQSPGDCRTSLPSSETDIACASNS